MTEMIAEAGPDVADPLAPDESAPFGYTIDRATGQRRPKKVAGRPKAGAEEENPDDVRGRQPVDRPRDREPGSTAVRGGRKNRAKEPEDIPAFRAGPIAKGMNRLYLKGGKIVRGFDPEVGQAMIDATKKESDEDVTVGEAWEEIARLNPRIRAFLLKLISGGAWGQLFMAHAPILLAVALKPAIMSRIPFAQVLESLAEAEEDTPEGEGALPGGMTAADAGEAMAFAQEQMTKMGLAVSPEMMAQAAALVGMPAGMPPNARPPMDHQVRQQPRSGGPRSKRRK